MALHIFSIHYLLFTAVALILCNAVVSNGHQHVKSYGDVYDQDVSHRIYPKHNTIIKAIYQFGDSLSDTGNCMYENPISVCGKLPYGITLSNTPTGRCSDGLLMIDYFTKFFNLPSLDPYLNKNGNFIHGANFAVGGATALNCSSVALRNNDVCPSSLLVQLYWFKSHLNSICSNVTDCKNKLATALVIMGEIGGNDYNFAFWNGENIMKIYKMVPEVVQVIKDTIKEVINLGAIRVVVPGDLPLGCLPSYLYILKSNDSRMYDELHCLEYLNDFAEFHNNKLQEAIRELQKDNPKVKIIYADYFSAFKEILQKPTSLGFDKDTMGKACYNIFENTVCENPDKYISWDGVHLTQHSYQLMAKWLIKYSFHDFYQAISSN